MVESTNGQNGELKASRTAVFRLGPDCSRGDPWSTLTSSPKASAKCDRRANCSVRKRPVSVVRLILGASRTNTQHPGQMFRHFARGVPLQDVLADVKVLVCDRLEMCAFAVPNRGTRITASRGRRALDDGANCSSVEEAAELSKAQVDETLMYLAAANREQKTSPEKCEYDPSGGNIDRLCLMDISPKNRLPPSRCY